MTDLYISAEEQGWLERILPQELVSELQFLDTEGADIQQTNEIWISSKGIHLPLAWFDQAPGYVFPTFMASEPAVMRAVLGTYLGDEQWLEEISGSHPALMLELLIFAHLQKGEHISQDLVAAWINAGNHDEEESQYRFRHNMAILLHYGDIDQTEEMPSLKECYESALAHAPNVELAGFTARHYATLLADTGRLDEAEAHLTHTLSLPLSQPAHTSLNILLSQILLDTLPFPVKEDDLTRLKELIWSCLQYCEEHELGAQTAMILISASRVANLSESFSESLGYINRSISMLEELELIELTGNALMQKGTLLYTWAQNGNPQFYRPAVETYQKAVKIFTKDLAPGIFASIQHHLAVLYSEMPDENKKRHIWAAISVRSFDEALSFFTKEQYPYEYGMICNNYGNALVKFPPAKNVDHVQMALDYYREALQVREA
ncbi:MAG: hypothetical protein NWR72_14325, partial [Bacteroidia bacterium]|nr:hypothetical protein [Bacteroidia bacterium]